MPCIARIREILHLTVRSIALIAASFVFTAATVNTTQTLGDKAIDRALWVFDHASIVGYVHSKQDATNQVRALNGSDCVAKTDCSGFISNVLREVAPKHYESIRRLQPERPYPQAKTYADFFASLPTDHPSEGWLGLASYADLHRGDLIAWTKHRKPETKNGRGNTGHVMLILDPPSPVRQ